MARLPCKDKGYEFTVPLRLLNGVSKRKQVQVRIHTVFKFTEKIFSYYLETYNEKLGDWIFVENKLFTDKEIKQYFQL